MMYTPHFRNAAHLALFLLIFFIFIPTPHASSYQMDLDILTFYVPDNPRRLAQGDNIFAIQCDRVDLYHPARMVQGNKNFLSCTVSYENVLNSDGSEWENIFIKSRESTLQGMIHNKFDGFIHKFSFGFQYAYDKATGKADYTEDNFELDYGSTIRRTLLACGIESRTFFSCGGGIEEYDNRTVVFWEAALRKPSIYEIGLRNFSRKFDLDFNIAKEGVEGRIPIKYSEDVLEIMTKLHFSDKLMVYGVIDRKHDQRRKLGVYAYMTQRCTLAYLRAYGSFDYHQDLYVNGEASGHNNGEADYSLWSAALQYKRSGETTYYFAMKRIDFFSESAGLVETEEIVNFWENLLAGKRYFNYSIGIDSTAYHMGVERKRGNMVTLRGGLQYIEMEPEGLFDNWTPFPFTGLGRLDEYVKELSYTEITFGVIALGFSLRIKSVEVTYGFTQFIPLSMKKRGGEGGESEEKKGSTLEWEDIEEVWDSIKDTPGGTFHGVEVIWYF
ncbi:MAG: hypothetical protein ACMUJM_05605 [bacterium]